MSVAALQSPEEPVRSHCRAVRISPFASAWAGVRPPPSPVTLSQARVFYTYTYYWLHRVYNDMYNLATCTTHGRKDNA